MTPRASSTLIALTGRRHIVISATWSRTSYRTSSSCTPSPRRKEPSVEATADGRPLSFSSRPIPAANEHVHRAAPPPALRRAGRRAALRARGQALPHLAAAVQRVDPPARGEPRLPARQARPARRAADRGRTRVSRRGGDGDRAGRARRAARARDRRRCARLDRRRLLRVDAVSRTRRCAARLRMRMSRRRHPPRRTEHAGPGRGAAGQPHPLRVRPHRRAARRHRVRGAAARALRAVRAGPSSAREELEGAARGRRRRGLHPLFARSLAAPTTTRSCRSAWRPASTRRSATRRGTG